MSMLLLRLTCEIEKKMEETQLEDDQLDTVRMLMCYSPDLVDLL